AAAARAGREGGSRRPAERSGKAPPAASTCARAGGGAPALIARAFEKLSAAPSLSPSRAWRLPSAAQASPEGDALANFSRPFTASSGFPFSTCSPAFATASSSLLSAKHGWARTPSARLAANTVLMAASPWPEGRPAEAERQAEDRADDCDAGGQLRSFLKRSRFAFSASSGGTPSFSYSMMYHSMPPVVSAALMI